MANKNTNTQIIRIFFFIVSLLCSLIFIDSSTIYAAPQGGTVISEIVPTFYEGLSKYENVMLKYAKVIFYWCAVLEVAWLGVKMSLGSSDIRETIKNFCFVLLAAGFFLAVINNYHTWTWNIINGLKSIAGEATNLVDASDKPFTVGLELAQSLFALCDGWSPAKSLTYILAGIAILFCFALITLQIILIKCECIIAMCASSVLLGLGATSFLRDYAINALRYVFAVAFKLMTMELVMGVGINFIMKLKMVETVTWGEIGVTLCFCVIFYCLVKTLPDVVAGIIQGSHVSSGQALTSTVMAMGAGLAGVGMAAGSGVANIGRAAQAAKAQGAEGVGGMVRGTASNLWNASREANHEKGLRQGSVASSLRDQIERARVESAAKSQSKKD
ncbi:P-type conjugative transfer protein TrbL [Desulfovibrio sp. 3_1_syn3]|uniref:P-type conjugative transfer protein TrbL n=1 Tax=Desulfovibrio sp. 3_1_syn3 TaxID=457398 RepID=UPI0001E12BFF|nr:P-type conjugative transfer protein TrbL [Desulfovibrio sp. 3_1_syn3]